MPVPPISYFRNRDTAIVAKMATEISGDHAHFRRPSRFSNARPFGSSPRGVLVGALSCLPTRWTPSPPYWLHYTRTFPSLSNFSPSMRPSLLRTIRYARRQRHFRADVEQIDVEGKDIAAIVRHAANAPVAKSGQQGERWQEAGYWLLPLLGLVVLVSFRRETK